MQKVALARAAKRAGLDAWLDTQTAAELELHVAARAKVKLTKPQILESDGLEPGVWNLSVTPIPECELAVCVASECWSVAVGWLLEQQAGRPDPSTYDVAGLVHAHMLVLDNVARGVRSIKGARPLGRRAADGRVLHIV